MIEPAARYAGFDNESQRRGKGGLTTKTRLLGVMTDELDALDLVLYNVCRDWWVMRNLFDKKVYLSASVAIWPVGIE